MADVVEEPDVNSYGVGGHSVATKSAMKRLGCDALIEKRVGHCCTCALGSCASCLVPWALCLVPCALCLVPCALCLVPCALDLVPWALGRGPWAVGRGPWVLSCGLAIVDVVSCLS
jgi:hypothetical protein